MKSIYWRPKKAAASTTFSIGVVAVALLTIVEVLPRWSTPEYAEEKLAANQHAQLCRYKIREIRNSLGLKINDHFDPMKTGLIGSNMTAITSKPGSLKAKQLSTHPQFPAAIVQMLREAGVRNGDTVAVGWTGSFPALNIALGSAIESLEIRPIVISSLTASQYGANEPELTWLDMESALHEAGLVGFRSSSATPGGPGDRGLGMSEKSRQQTLAAMDRNDVEPLKIKHLAQSIEKRMRMIQRMAKSRPIVAYINVGGGVASCGGEESVFPAGVTSSRKESDIDCVMQRFCDRGVPVVHLAHPRTLAERFGLSKNEEEWHVAAMSVPNMATPNRWLALGMLVLVCLLLRGIILKDFGYRLGNAVLRRIQGQPVLRKVGQVDGPKLMA